MQAEAKTTPDEGGFRSRRPAGSLCLIRSVATFLTFLWISPILASYCALGSAIDLRRGCVYISVGFGPNTSASACVVIP